MKKKILAAGIIVCMLAIAVVGGSLAWFTDTDEATNVFTIGSVEIEQNEEFDPPSAMIPVGSNETPEDDVNYVQKEVTVTNTGKNDAYVQTFVAIRADLDEEETLDDGLLHIHYEATATSATWEVIDGDENKDGKQPVAYDVMIEGVAYNVYKFRCYVLLAPEATTLPAIKGVYIDQAADLNTYQNATGNTDRAHFVWNDAEITTYNATEQMMVYVATQAVQAEGFTTAQEALDSAFGDAHPWAD